jgi:uncharacterized protein (DUF934 family)
MALIKDGRLVDDPYLSITDEAEIPGQGPVIVSLTHWQKDSDRLRSRGEPFGVRLGSDEHPEAIADQVNQFAVIALEFPVFRDGRAYSYARLIRERYGFDGELRAVGDVLLEQLHYMDRVGFNAFEFDSDEPEKAFKIASQDFSVWYQPSGDDRPTAVQLRRGLKPPSSNSNK